MISDAQFTNWLKRPDAKKSLFVALEHATGTEYISHHGLITEPHDPLPNITMPGIISTQIDVESALSGRASFGELEIINTGRFDAWLQHTWAGYAVRIYLGDERWTTDNYRQIALATNGGIQAASQTSISFDLINAAAFLDTPVLSEAGSEPLIPRVIGRPQAVTPVLVDPITLTYRVSDRPLSAVSVKENGLPVSISEDLSQGEFTLEQARLGTLTVDPVDQTTETVAQILALAAQEVGLMVDQQALEQLPSYQVGVFVSDNRTWAALLDEVCGSISTHWWVTAAGVLTCARLAEPSDIADHQVSSTAIHAGAMELIAIERPVSHVEVRYGRRYTRLTTVATVLDEATRERMGAVWDTQVEANDLPSFRGLQPFVVETALISALDAAKQAAYLARLKSPQRQQWRLVMSARAATFQEGQTVSITHPRYGWQDGRNALITSVRKALARDQIELEVWL